MLARARLFRRIAGILVVACSITAVGCGKGAYEERLKNTVNQLTQQAGAAAKGETAAEPEAEAPEN